MSKSGSSQQGSPLPASSQQQGQSAPTPQQSAGSGVTPKPQIRDWACNCSAEVIPALAK